MKKIIQVSIVVLLTLAFTQCKTVNLRIRLTNPPMIQAPDYVKQIAVVNRTLIDSAKKDKNIIESIVTGEAILGDKIAAEDCIYSFSKYMNAYGPIPTLIPEKHRLYGNIGGFDLEPIKWETVNRICRENKSNALMSLEKFDTNSDATVGAIQNGVNIFNATINGNAGSKDIHYNVMYRWRLYDTLAKQVIYYKDDVIHQTAHGLPLLSPLPIEAVKNTAVFLGETEANKFNSTYFWVHREYYKKGKSSDFSIGYRRAYVNDWDGAIEMWTKCLQSPNRKTAGRACYNIAIAHEVKGNLQEAMKWARKSFSDYGTPLAKDYVYVLQNRINSGQ